MEDFEAYQRALNAANAQDGGEGSYMNSLMSSMCLVLEEFYNNLRVGQSVHSRVTETDIQAVGVSAMTGEGMKSFFEAVDEARKEYDA
jgi:hypothetical protein